MTVFASDLNRRARFVVKIAVAVRILAEVAVDAVHSLFKMNVVEVDGFLELVGIVRCDQIVFGVKQVSFSIAFEDFAKHPAMTVKIAKLRVL